MARHTSPYLEDIPRAEAQARLRAALTAAGAWRVLGVETIRLHESCVGRVTAAPIWARRSSPSYHAAAMDGFAVDSHSTVGAAPAFPVILLVDLPASSQALGARYVDTGDPLPEWADAVVPVEQVEPLDGAGRASALIRAPHSIRLRAPIASWEHIRPVGEDIVATQLVVPGGTVLREVDLGAIAAAGHDTIRVARRPKVAIIPTGSELVPVGEIPGPSGIVEFNSIVLAAQVNRMGGIATRYDIVPDNVDLLAAAVKRAAFDHDMVVLNAGSSAGAEDFSSTVVGNLGEVLVHGVAVRPGHPVIIGLLRQELTGADGLRVIFGVPGYPVSAALTMEIFVEPVLAVWQGRQPAESEIENAALTRKVTSPPGDEDFVRVTLGRVGGRLLAAPIPGGAGVMTSLVRADGVVVIPPGTQGMDAGDGVSVRLYKSRRELERSLFCIGSHDVALDLMAQYLAALGIRLASTNAGSQGGLIALQRQYAHMAGCHLLDPVSGEYNVRYVQQYLSERRIKMVTLALRDQGLLVRPGNPKRILGLEDLTRDDVRFVNRQRGSGTRVLLDYQMERLGLSQNPVYGYNIEVYTHLAVAAAVASGRADCGLAVSAAAAALGLDFVPIVKERYDLVIDMDSSTPEMLSALMGLLGPGAFRDDVAKLPGYDVSPMGTIVLEEQ